MNSLYALRFFASIGILLHHLNYPLGLGTICVTFFFVMSGYTTAYSNQKKNFIVSRESIKQFYFKKILKMYPLYLLTFFLSIPIMNYMNIGFDIKNVLKNLFMLQTIYPNKNEVFYFNGLVWFMVDIIIFYIFTPFLHKLFEKIKSKYRVQILLLLAVLIFIVGFIISYNFKWKMQPYTFGWWFIYISPYFRFFDFIIGYIIGLLFASQDLSKVNKPITKILYTIAEIGSLLLLYLSYKSPYIQIDSLRYGIYYVPASIIIIYIFSIGKGYTSKLLSTTIIVNFGKLSFIIYMIHQLTINYIMILLGNPMYNNEKTLLNNSKSAIFIFLIVLCFSEFINKYYIKEIDKLIGRFKKIK